MNRNLEGPLSTNCPEPSVTRMTKSHSCLHKLHQYSRGGSRNLTGCRVERETGTVWIRRQNIIRIAPG